MYLAVMVAKIVKQDVREWCPSTRGPLHCPPLILCLHLAGRCYTSGTTLVSCPSQRCLSRIWLPLLPVPTTKRAPSLGSMFNFSA